jgi:uncharacterized membrane protein
MNSKTRRFFIGKICIILAMLLLWRWMYDKLPLQVPMHRNAQWIVDGYGSRLATVFVLPCICVFFLLLFFLIPKIDPKRASYKEFSSAREWIQIMLFLYFAYFYAMIFYIIMHPEVSILPLISWGIGVLFFVLWIAMKRVKSNYFVGIKTPRTLANETVWNKTHVVWAWTFASAWVLCVIDAFVWIAVFPVFFSAIILGAIIPVIYSYFIYQKIVK